ncbi:ultra-long-chain fatty acid omega-hydroxylase-like [Amphiura filiformis]|uniref:ultra-long-chain fatty acid omega-hydroxylase-like n=1 Tax=Amphiura filiformis TaxID=82378 RepID=UPI003B21039D
MAYAVISTIVVAIVAIIVVKLLLLFHFRLKYKLALKAFTEHPNGATFFGHTEAYTKGFNGVERNFTAVYENGNTALQVWMGPFYPGVSVYHPDNLKAIFATMEPKEKKGYGFLEPWLGPGLLLSTGKKWSRNRRLLTPGFHFDVLKPYIKIHWESAKKLEAKMRELCANGETSIDMSYLLGQATVESLMKCVMGLECDIQGQRHPPINHSETQSAFVAEEDVSSLTSRPPSMAS